MEAAAASTQITTTLAEAEIAPTEAETAPAEAANNFCRSYNSSI